MTPLEKAREAMRAFRAANVPCTDSVGFAAVRADIAAKAAVAADALEEAGYLVDASWMRSDAYWWEHMRCLELDHPEKIVEGDCLFYGLSEEEWPT